MNLLAIYSWARFGQLKAASGFDRLEQIVDTGVAKTGRPKAGEGREERVQIAPRITVSQKEKLDWLTVKLKLSIAELTGQWIEAAFEARGEFDPGEIARSRIHDRAVEFVRALAEGRKPDVLEVGKLSDEMGIPIERLAALVRECCCEQTEGGKDRGKTRV